MESDNADWPVTRDHALVLYVDSLCRFWSTTPSRLMPDELHLSEVDLTSEDFHQLQGGGIITPTRYLMHSRAVTIQINIF